MPGMSGYELTRLIRESAGPYKSIPVIACTADNSPSVEHKANLSGINEVMYKPYDLLQLYRTVQDFLPKHNPINEESGVGKSESKTLYWLDKFQDKQKNEMANIVVTSLNEGLTDLDNKDADIGMVAHRIKGSAGALGILELFDLASQLEKTPNDSHLLGGVIESMKKIIYQANNYIENYKE